jgi:hypothetical protein
MPAVEKFWGNTATGIYVIFLKKQAVVDRIMSLKINQLFSSILLPAFHLAKHLSLLTCHPQS